MYRTLIWATDGSEQADAALEEARRLAELTAARIVAVHCDQYLVGRAGGASFFADEEERRAKIRAQVSALRSAGLDVDLVVRRTHESPARVIAEIAESVDADFVVCGTRGLGAFSGALLGSVAQRLLHTAPCAIVAVPEHRPAKGQAAARETVEVAVP